MTLTDRLKETWDNGVTKMRLRRFWKEHNKNNPDGRIIQNIQTGIISIHTDKNGKIIETFEPRDDIGVIIYTVTKEKTEKKRGIIERVFKK